MAVHQLTIPYSDELLVSLKSTSVRFGSEARLLLAIKLKEETMAVRLQVSQVIDRPVVDVFHFHAHEHVRNHPRWDPDIELEQVSDGPIEIGTIMRRRNCRSGTPVEGTMEVVEFEPNRVFGVVIHDGPVEMHGRTTFEALGNDQTTITTFVEIPSMDDSMDTSFLTSRMESSVQNMKRIMESEI
jgi:hypothetical protein